MLLHCTMTKLVTASITAGVGDWITTEVSTVNSEWTIKYHVCIFVYVLIVPQVVTIVTKMIKII